MATKKDIRRTKIKYRIRHKVSGTATMPRLSVFRSNKEIYAQVIDDEKGVTLTAASTLEKSVEKSGTKSEMAAKVVSSSQSVLLLLVLIPWFSTVMVICTTAVLNR